MTVQEIITEVRQIVQELDPNNTHAGDNVIVGWINACTLQLCSTISTLPKVSISNIVAAATVTFPTNALKMDYASITDGATPAVHSNLETIDFVNFARISPGWEDQPVSKPQYLVRMTDLTWMMWPNPNATWTGKALTLIGTILPTPLAYPADLSNNPAISITIHPCYSHYCAWKFFTLLNNTDRAGAEFTAYDGLRKMNVNTATSTTGSQLSLKMRGM